jgi:hypothetical protein
MVHRREIDGREIMLGNQGDLFLRAMTWWDHETGSVWSQPSGEAILGPLAGTRLELLPSSLTTWENWRRDHPGTLALDAEGGSAGFEVEDTALVVEVGPHPVAYPVEDVQVVGGVVNDQLGDLPVAVVVDPDDANAWRVYSREVAGEVVELAWRDGELVDTVTGTTFHPTLGTVGEGTLAEPLLPLPAFPSFASDFRNHFPGGRFWVP